MAAAGSATVVATADPEPEVQVVRLGGAYLGVVLEDVGKDDLGRLKLADEKGAVVKRVEEDSPAAEAGIKEGDVILRYQGEAVLSVAQLIRLVRETPAGRTVSLEVSRDGATQRLAATLAGRKGGPFWYGDWNVQVPELTEWPFAKGEIKQLIKPEIKTFRGDLLGGLVGGPRRLGIEYVEVSGQLARYFRIEGDGGVLVSNVDDDGPAAKAGLKAGDVIVKLAGKRVSDGADLRRALAGSDPGSEVTITAYRDGRALELKVTLAGRRVRRPGVST
jgi:S1-C subfamily serine protease